MGLQNQRGEVHTNQFGNHWTNIRMRLEERDYVIIWDLICIKTHVTLCPHNIKIKYKRLSMLSYQWDKVHTHYQERYTNWMG